MDLNKFLEGMLTLKASDLYITVGAPILFRVDGELRPQGEKLTEHDVAKLLDSAMDPDRHQEFRKSANQTLLSSEIVVASVLVLFFSENCREQSFAVSKPLFLLLSS